MTRGLPEMLAERFGEAPDGADVAAAPELWHALAGRASCRAFTAERVDPGLVDTLCALALSAPTKSDLQQRDIVIVEDAGLRARLDDILTQGRLGQPWIAGAPHLIVFCGNNRRLRLAHGWRGKPFVNDHLDAFFNAAVDAGIALAAFVLAAEACGLGCCPISAIRNEAARVSDLLRLADHVFPVAALALGRPARPPQPSPRLPLEVTVHRDRYREEGLRDAVEAYDRRRERVRPYASQRYVEDYGEAAEYGWSEDKVRQYSRPERESFGAFVRARGFRLD